jgi:hypothetical protein
MSAPLGALYVNIAADRFFEIPHDLELPSGDFSISSLTGSQRHVDRAAVGHFEVSQEQAVAHVRARVEHTISALTTAITDALDLPDDMTSLDHASATRAAATALRAFAEIIETEKASAGRQIDAMIGRLERELGPLVGDLRQPDERQKQASYDRSAKTAIADALRAAGIRPIASQDRGENAEDVSESRWPRS